jgi:hypothetical protein
LREEIQLEKLMMRMNAYYAGLLPKAVFNETYPGQVVHWQEKCAIWHL